MSLQKKVAITLWYGLQIQCHGKEGNILVILQLADLDIQVLLLDHICLSLGDGNIQKPKMKLLFWENAQISLWEGRGAQVRRAARARSRISSFTPISWWQWSSDWVSLCPIATQWGHRHCPTSSSQRLEEGHTPRVLLRAPQGQGLYRSFNRLAVGVPLDKPLGRFSKGSEGIQAPSGWIEPLSRWIQPPAMSNCCPPRQQVSSSRWTEHLAFRECSRRVLHWGESRPSRLGRESRRVLGLGYPQGQLRAPVWLIRIWTFRFRLRPVSDYHKLSVTFAEPVRTSDFEDLEFDELPESCLGKRAACCSRLARSSPAASQWSCAK